VQGAGIHVDFDRSRYEGLWVAGKREGKGRETFTRGGSYDGEWKNDNFDGAGTIVYAGTPSHTWQGSFRSGRPEGLPDPVLATAGAYSVKADHNAYGSTLRSTVATAALPPAASRAQLSPEEQNNFRMFYRALAPDDEPPYPLQGTGPTIKLAAQVQAAFELNGKVYIYVVVGTDGKAKSASVIGKIAPEAGRYLMAAFMTGGYKPAKCQGAPCEMIYPICFLFGL
jgi:hypothetical protein